MLDQLFSLLLQLWLASLAVAAPISDDVTATVNPAQQWGAGGGIVGFIILVLDIIVWSTSEFPSTDLETRHMLTVT